MRPTMTHSLRAERTRPIIRIMIATVGCAVSMVLPAESRGSQPAGGAAGAEAVRREPAPRAGPLNRRVLNGEPTVLAFKNVTVEQLVPFIVESTGKVVLPRTEVLSRTITLLNDEPIPRSRALDLVILALQQAGVAVVESPEVITLRDINDLSKQDVPVLGPSVSVLEREDLGSVVEKVFALSNGSADNIGAIVKEMLPDYAKVQIDAVSNQLVVLGNIGLLQRIERLITTLDRPSAAALNTETFRLRYADAEVVAQNIRDLFAADARAQQQQGGGNPFQAFFQGGGQQQQGRGGQQQQQGRGGQQQGQAVGSLTSASLRVSANKQQNSVTVLAERPVLEQIRDQIDEYWDKPLPEEAVVPKVYDLQNSDPVKVRDLLEGLFGRATTTGTQQQSGQSSQGVGRLAGQFSFQAIPESGRLVVVSKSPDNIAVIDRIIADLDQPQSAGLPQLIELKHAQAEELAEQINTLLAQDGTLASIRRSESGLTSSSSSASPFASTATTQDTAQTEATADTIAFWWQRSRPPTDRRGASNLIGAIRIVPVWRQNALMILSPPEYRAAVGEMIRELDKPGRQVLISAIVCEISREDATALGLRWSSQNISPTNADNSINIGNVFTGAASNVFGSLFDTSVIDTDINLNLLLQALNEKTDLNILSEPKVFTSDNQEAEFFDGQDIPFVNDTTTNQVGQITSSFDYKAVGIQLRARPRITVNRDVDLKVNLELSSIFPGQTVQGALIVDRRETTTQLILKDGQTVVISGILRKEESEIVRKVPLLGDIPLIGELFKSREKSFVEKELLVFITPRVVENTDSLIDLNKPFNDRLNTLRRNLSREDPNPPATDPTPPSPGPITE
ncbi:MAG: hypothetical protein HRU70_09490 [Phycisphaeraceae bacterium]|nr:MAG: hypothetical protein HRU70_09490 [Phycisphaeraceae bacterium]